jgi:D-glycero-D-manno-heptose 1,7-bisphosphate phosphatase
VKKYFMEKGFFLDRDGIVNVDKGYVYQKDNFVFYEDIFRLCRLVRDHGFKIFIVTNQSGIGRGYYTLDEFNVLNDWMLETFLEHGIRISKVYFCPHHPTEGKGEFKINCQCRKPNPGMILQAREEFGLNLEASILIGDSEKDIEAGINAGIGQVYLISNKTRPDVNPAPTAIFKDLGELMVHLEDVLI